MQVEYEEIPTAVAESSVPRSLEPAEEETVDEEGEEEEEEAEEADEGGEAGEKGAKEKKKRIFKSRQSLSEKRIGTTIFPISRIKRIIKADKDLDMMSNEASFMVAVATEYFIKHFMEEGYTKARLDNRKIVNYKDMAAVVARSEEFDFLIDVIPNPIPISEALERRRQKVAADENPTLYDEPEPTTSGPEKLDPILVDDLPPLALSTNPLFPNAIVKKAPNAHAKGPQKPSQTQSPAVLSKALPATPRVITGKNAPSTPHSLTTRSARKSLVTGEGGPEVESAVESGTAVAGNADGAVQHTVSDERMEVD